MQVGVHDFLAAYLTAIPAHVIPIGCVFLIYPRLGTLQQVESGSPFVHSQIEDGLSMVFGNDESRTYEDRFGSLEKHAVSVLQDHLRRVEGRRTERALHQRLGWHPQPVLPFRGYTR